MDVRHIKITTSDGLFRINDKKAFRGLIVSLRSHFHPPEKSLRCFKGHYFDQRICCPLQELIQFYQQNSLKEYFKEVDTILCTPFKKSEESNSTSTTPNTTPSTVQLSTSQATLGIGPSHTKWREKSSYPL